MDSLVILISITYIFLSAFLLYYRFSRLLHAMKRYISVMYTIFKKKKKVNCWWKTLKKFFNCESTKVCYLSNIYNRFLLRLLFFFLLYKRKQKVKNSSKHNFSKHWALFWGIFYLFFQKIFRLIQKRFKATINWK